jgi:hypothetical protein
LAVVGWVAEDFVPLDTASDRLKLEWTGAQLARTPGFRRTDSCAGLGA